MQACLAVIIGKRLHVEDFVDQYLTKDAYVKTYSHIIHPIPSEDQCPESTQGPVVPQEKRKLPRRPKKSRKRAADEPQRQKRSSSVPQGARKRGLISRIQLLSHLKFCGCWSFPATYLKFCGCWSFPANYSICPSSLK
ncbi:hypothetical protein ACOSP7_021029 [Xanthoceras sorbifolium]